MSEWPPETGAEVIAFAENTVGIQLLPWQKQVLLQPELWTSSPSPERVRISA